MPPGADPHQRRPVGAADALDRVERVEHRLDIRVQAPRGMPGVRVAPRDHEHLLAAPHQVLDQAPPRCQVEGVVLVDGRRRNEQRYLPDPLGLWPVLDQLQVLGPQHHRAGRDGYGAADRERRGVHHLRDPRRRGHVAQEAQAAAGQAAAGGVDGRLRGLGVHQRQVARRQRLDQVVHQEAHPLVVAPVQPRVVDQRAGGPIGGQVALHGAVQQRVLRPRRVGEPAVPLGRRDGRGADADPGQLRGQAAQPAAGRQRVAGQPGGEPDRRGVRGQPAPRAQRGVDEQRIERSRPVGQLLRLRIGHLSTGHGTLLGIGSRVAGPGRSQDRGQVHAADGQRQHGG